MVDVKVGVVLLCLALVADVWGDAVSWGYDRNHGPDTWSVNYFDCGGVMQSPIDIETKTVLYDHNLEHFDLMEYGRTEGINMTLVNVGGHTAEVILSGPNIHLSRGGLPDAYVVEQFHFHWGNQSERGSEHSINGRHYPMEMHIVHHQGRLDNSSTASQHPHGLHVFGFFFEIGEHNHNFDHIVENLNRIEQPDQRTRIPTFALRSLLPEGNIDFFRYSGSLTTPPCYESVIWTISANTIKISENQMSQFRTLRNREEGQLVDDFRPIQPKNNRLVTTTVKSMGLCGSSLGDAGNFLSPSITTVTTTLVVALTACLLQILL